METRNLKNEPAFPFFETNASGYENTVVVDTPTGRLYLPFQSGMSKRFYAACAAMQGLLSANPEYTHGNVPIPVLSVIAGLSFEFADELLKQENE